ncbi:MAG: alpha/beta hydrolase [Crocinitomicaceae bacterium]
MDLKHSKTYRYELIPCKGKSKKVLYVLHGYGQLAKFFIRKFEVLSEEYHIVAPEGMHRFYLQGSSGRVGASWMTKEARESDIEDNLNWLNALDDKITQQLQVEERHLLGFSQGGATAARWFADNNQLFISIVLWACVFPPDLEPEAETAKFNSDDASTFVIGTEDEYYNTEQQKALIDFYEGLSFKTVTFEGKHNIDSDVLKAIYDSNV